MYENFHRRIIIYGSLIYQKSCYSAHFVHPLRANLQPQKKTKLFHKFKRVFLYIHSTYPIILEFYNVVRKYQNYINLFNF